MNGSPDVRLPLPTSQLSRASSPAIERISLSSTANGFPYARGLARRSTSWGGMSGSRRVRTSSRRRRRSLLRSTMVCWKRGTTMPTRGYESGETSVRTSMYSARTRLPSCLTRSISALRVNRERRGKANPPLRCGVLRGNPDGQPLAALLPAAAQNFAAPLSRHARAKTVRANAALVARPVGGLTHYLLRMRLTDVISERSG